MSKDSKKSDKSITSSERSSQSDTSKVSNYLTYDLLKDIVPQSTKKVSIVEDIAVSKDPTIDKIVWETAKRDLALVNNDGVILDGGKKKDINQVLATIICYEKRDGKELKTVNTFQIISPNWMLVDGKPFSQDGRPNYKDEVKEAIFQVEMEFFVNILNYKKDAVNKALEDLNEEFLPLDVNYKRMETELAELKLRNRTERNSELGQQIKSLGENLKKFKIDNNYQLLLESSKVYESEIEQINKLLDIENNTLLIDSVKAARGHSEDYLYYFLNDERGQEYIKSIVTKDSDRVYLVISSTRDACRRCCWKVEEMVDIIGKSLQERNGDAVEDPAKSIICKALYFSNQEMKDKDHKSSMSKYDDTPITDDNLSSSTKSAIHFRPVPTTSENRGLTPNEERLKLLTFASRNLRIREELDKQQEERGTPSPVPSISSSDREKEKSLISDTDEKSRSSR